MESVAYILILALAIGTLFFAIAFREPPRIGKQQSLIIAINCLNYKMIAVVAELSDNGILISDFGLGTLYDRYACKQFLHYLNPTSINIAPLPFHHIVK